MSITKKYDYQKNREYQLEYQKTSQNAKDARERWRKKNKDKWNSYSRKYLASDLGRLRQVLNQFKQKAARELIPFELTIDFLSTFPSICPIIGIPIRLSDTKTSPNSISVFMKDPLLGYTEDNCLIVSSRVTSLLEKVKVAEIEKIIAFMSNYQ